MFTVLNTKVIQIRAEKLFGAIKSFFFVSKTKSFPDKVQPDFQYQSDRAGL